MSDALGLNPQYDATGKVVKDSAGNVQYATEFGQKYAAMSVADKLGTSTFWIQTGTNAAASGIASAANGGTFGQGFGISALTSTAAMLYQSTVGYDAKIGPGKNPDDPFYKPVVDKTSPDYGRQPPSTFENNVIGDNRPGYLCSQGTTCSKALNLVPFINATGGFHDYIFNHEWLPMNALTNVGTMLPAAAIAIPASLNNPNLNWQLTPKKEEKK